MLSSMDFVGSCFCRPCWRWQVPIAHGGSSGSVVNNDQSELSTGEFKCVLQMSIGGASSRPLSSRKTNFTSSDLALFKGSISMPPE